MNRILKGKMGKVTGIEWCDSTWNCWVGCRKISAGCQNCYMFRGQKRYGNNPSEIRKTGNRTFNSPLRWKEPKVIFVCSWSDFFIKEADQWRDDAWKIIKEANQHTYLILTKRPERITDNIPDDWYSGKYNHVWLGITAENNKCFIQRGRLLASLDKSLNLEKRTFISFEPLVIPIDLSRGYVPDIMDRIGWTIVGGESGGKVAREMNPDWARSIRDYCKNNEIPFFFKQMTNHKEIPEDLKNVKERPMFYEKTRELE